VIEYRFIADVHLGKLARLLRLLGFDTAYKNNLTKEELVTISSEEKRTLLSRDSSIAKVGLQQYLIVTTEDPLQQLKQVVKDLRLTNHFQPFSRCIACNGNLEMVPKESILPLLGKNTKEYYHEFWQCNNCKRIYWKGSHYERMLKTIERIQQA
jgi:uncharacterized protein